MFFPLVFVALEVLVSTGKTCTLSVFGSVILREFFHQKIRKVNKFTFRLLAFLVKTEIKYLLSGS